MGQRYRAARCPRERSHLQIIWLLSQGRSEREVAAVTGYGQRWIAEVVFTQTTKTHLLTAGAEGDDVADLDLAAGDQHAIDQQLDQLPLPSEVGVGQARLNPPAEVRSRCRPARELRLAINLGFQLVGLGTQRLRPVFHRLSATLVFRQGNDSKLVCLGQALQLPLKPELALAQLFAPGLEFLRQPSTAMRPGQGLGDVLRLGEQRA